jgi:uncharacterized UBP type Zn finger protein
MITTGDRLNAPGILRDLSVISGTALCELPTQEKDWAGGLQKDGAFIPLKVECTPIHETPAPVPSTQPFSPPPMLRSASSIEMEAALETSKQEWAEAELKRAADQASFKRTANASTTKFQSGVGTAPHRGLVNLGNTCYLNSALQLLAANADLRDLLSHAPSTFQAEAAPTSGPIGYSLARPFLTRQPSNRFAELERARALRNVLAEVTDSSMHGVYSEAISPGPLHELLPSPFNGFEQQDADEALHEVLLECLEQGGYAASPSSVSSSLSNIYGGEIHRQILCLACADTHSPPPEPINALQLPLEGPGGALDNLSIERLINAYFSDNTEFGGIGNGNEGAAPGEPTRYCDSQTCRGTRQHALQTTVFHKVPRHLLLALKRFDGLCGKKSVPVTLDETLHVQTSEGQLVFDLYAVVVHRGPTPNSGHYFTFARDSGDDSDTAPSKGRRVWHKYDDTHVSPVTRQEWDALVSPSQAHAISEAEGDFSDLGYEPTPYILCYRRRNS